MTPVRFFRIRGNPLSFPDFCRFSAKQRLAQGSRPKTDKSQGNGRHRGIAVPAHQARIYLDGRAVATLDGSEADAEDFGLIVFQEGFLDFLHRQCSRFGHYRLDVGTTVTGLVREGERVVGVRVRGRDGQQAIAEGDFFVAAAGRSTALRAKAGLATQVLESSFDIYWMKFDPPQAPDDGATIPDGFHAYLQDQSMFIFYRTYDQRIQVAWGKRSWNASGLRDLAGPKQELVWEAPAQFRGLLANQFSERTERQLLKVACDRLNSWHVPGMLFIGDAAHTMSPVAGQGINLAIRDSIVAANHMIRARVESRAWDSAMCQAIEEERLPEVEAMQAFQVRMGHLMLGAPPVQRRLFFRYGLPLLAALGIRQRFVRQVQSGVTELDVEFPVTLSEVTRG